MDEPPGGTARSDVWHLRFRGARPRPEVGERAGAVLLRLVFRAILMGAEEQPGHLAGEVVHLALVAGEGRLFLRTGLLHAAQSLRQSSMGAILNFCVRP